MEETYKLLNTINSPQDLLNGWLRHNCLSCVKNCDFIIVSTAENPGHLGASLGVIELTVALHYVFNTPFDKLVWDVGHQAYCHKILTGRREQFHTNRQYEGICGFQELMSEYDAFGTGHSSTSISAVLGMAMADSLSNNHSNSIAVIGGGAIGRMAFEAMNHAEQSS